MVKRIPVMSCFLWNPQCLVFSTRGDGQQTRIDKIIGTVQDTADTAIGSVNKTASDAVESIGKAEESISKSVTDARASADAAANSEQQAAASVTAAQNAVNGFGLQAGTTTTGEPGSNAAVEIQKTGTKYIRQISPFLAVRRVRMVPVSPFLGRLIRSER